MQKLDKPLSRRTHNIITVIIFHIMIIVNTSNSEQPTIMFDITPGPTDTDTYECLACGTIVSAITHPDPCPECGTDGMQHRGMSLE